MKSAKTLENFLENYIKNKEKANAPRSDAQSYQSWLVQNGAELGRAYDESLQKIGTSLQKSKSTYGNTAENLSDRGLSGGGYARYIDSLAKKEARAQSLIAEDSYIDSSARNMSSYYSYLSDFEKNEKKKYDNAIKNITDLGYMDYESAYMVAIEHGLSENRASEAAISATGMIKEKKRTEVINLIVKESLTFDETYEYAISIGLAESDARELAEHARKMNEYIPSTPAEKPKKPVGSGKGSEVSLGGGGVRGATYKSMTQ